jgi:hypothetical protein
MAVKVCASNRVEPSAAMMSAAKVRMAETVAAVSMAATMTSSMSAAVTATLGYRAARERHREHNEHNSN